MQPSLVVRLGRHARHARHARPTRRATHTPTAALLFPLFLASLALAASTACSDSTAAASTGALTVTVSGLPAGASGAVLVVGPNAYARTLNATTTLASLAPGTYTVAAADVTVGDVRWTGSPPTQSVTVRAGRTPSAAAVSYSDIQLDLQPVASGLANPVFLTAPPGDTRLFIVEQAGRIRIAKGRVLLATPFLDISSRVASGGERGLLSMAFDPAYATNGFFYVCFTLANGDVTVERYAATPGTDVASAAAPTPVITVPHATYSNHNGGLVAFGPDGMLYLGTGDGGGAGDPLGSGQNSNTLLGKLLRLDVRTLPYTIPPTNPFAGQSGRRGEIWAYGLRNPWRYAWRTPAGASASMLYIADVGQGSYEEIDVTPASEGGVNYGWNVMEGAHCYPPGSACATAGVRSPTAEYDHSQGCSITGGYVYRGASLPEVAGHYFYSDYCGGWLASLSGDAATGFVVRRWDVPNAGNVTSFGEDGAGELYLVSANGWIYKLVRK